MSSQTSGITGGDLSGFAERDEASNLDLLGKDSSEWTNEKHSMYLKSMEASFVHQLYKSMEASQMKASNYAESHTITGQFKVHQSGCWQRIKVGRGEPPPRQSEDSQLLSQNPWIQRFRPRGRDNKVVHTNPSINGGAVNCGERSMYACGLSNMLEHTAASQLYQDSSISRDGRREGIVYVHSAVLLNFGPSLLVPQIHNGKACSVVWRKAGRYLFRRTFGVFSPAISRSSQSRSSI